MMTISGYKTGIKIYENDNTVIFRGLQKQYMRPVILKVLKKDRSTPVESARFKHEYRIIAMLNNERKIEGVVEALSIVENDNILALIFEDFGGESLDKLMSERKFSLGESLSVAIKITKILEKIHAANIIHKDINPSNIVMNPVTGRLKIIDFGISTFLSCEDPLIKCTGVLEGTLAYISPEQTGRLNRPLDYRTDFYSLGATFYEILCQKPPFESSDSLALVHSHIAMEPAAPHKIDKKIYLLVSDIVMKLLSKNAGDRYQSARGIRMDLEKCLNQLTSLGRIEIFPLARHDLSGTFRIYRKLYGREKEIKTLMDGFKRVSKGDCEVLFISGHPGIGKTALVKEVYKPVTLLRGYFISGRFERLQKSVPYSGLAAAFRELMRQILTESNSSLAMWREKFLGSLGTNGQIIIDVIPEVELIAGPQPSVPELGPVETRNRFNMIFRNFIRIFCRIEHPLVIFLDDLQWADPASLKLIQLIVTDKKVRYLFLICACRENEAGSDPLAAALIGDLESRGVTMNLLALPPLSVKNITQLVSDTLKIESEQAMPLARAVLQKTGGNPLSIEMFLKSLYFTNQLVFNFEQGGWQWDLDRIQNMGINNNAADLIALKLKNLDKKTQNVLQLAACTGNQFNLQILAYLCKKSVAQIASLLKEAVDEGFVLPVGDAYKSVELDLKGNENEAAVNYKFLHGRIQNAVHLLSSETERAAMHQLVGTYLLQNTPKPQLEEKIFDIVNQFNFGLELKKFRLEKNELAGLNLIAGRKAKASAAYESAFNYFLVGLSLLDEDVWTREYDFILNYYVEAAEAAYLCGRFEKMDEFIEAVMRNAQTLMDRVRVFEVKIDAYKAQYKLQEALKTSVNVLKLLGVELPANPGKLNISLCFAKTKAVLLSKQIEGLAGLPEMKDPALLASVRILSSAGSAAYFSMPSLLPIIVFKLVNLSVKYGRSPGSAFIYATYGMILCGMTEDIESGYRFGRLALNLLEKSKTEELKARTFHMVYGFIFHWKEHIRKYSKLLAEGFKSGLETGDFEYAGFCAFFYCYHSFISGVKLDRVEQDMARYSDAIGQLKYETSFYMHEIFRQAVSDLRRDFNPSVGENPPLSDGEIYNEKHLLPTHLKINDRTTLFILYFVKLFLNYLFGDYKRAVENAARAKKYLDGVTGMLVVSCFFFYDSLASLALFNDLPTAEQKNILKKVAANQKKMEKWAHCAPMNHLHKFYLVEAEIMRVMGNDLRAADNYDRAVNLANEHEYINDESLANELAAKFYLAKSRTNIAKAYMQAAFDCYLKWGASAKAKDLDIRYGSMITATVESAKAGIKKDHKILQQTSRSTLKEDLDIMAVMKASQAISGEIVLSDLLKQLMAIIVENAGAQKGFFILKRNGRFKIEAAVHTDTEYGKIDVLQSVPIEKSSDLSKEVVRFVIRSKESLVINNASNEKQFIHDPYIESKQPKSILCMPLSQKDIVSGVLYLENNLITSAFTKDRIRTLNILLSQAAISLENAFLYEDLKQEITDRKLAEKQLMQNQKMEAIGTLAGGIAHDFNNILSAIMGYTELASYEVSDGSKTKDHLNKVLAACNRAKELVQQILGFSRQTEQEIKPVMASLIVKEAVKLLKASLPAMIEIHQNIIAKSSKIMVDPTRFHQVVLNICTNAADAMREKGGILEVGLVEVEVDREAAGTLNLDPGPYVRLIISDTGHGIDPGIKERIFDPFFTTKELGKGTGMGLSVVHGIVQGYDGAITFYSEPGTGTTFHVFLPRIDQKSISDNEPVPCEMPTGSGCILFIDDEEMLVELGQKMLQQLGFHVVAAKSGVGALKIFSKNPNKFDLVITDQTMPKMTGIDTAVEMMRIRPDIPVILCSGFSEMVTEEKARAAGIREYIMKPYFKHTIAEIIRKVLDGRDTKK